uniref:Uncharacterized protein n=1 Tax=uncultured bacterium contig00021 TaxID=1181511 RepID=A0A806KLH5_9BACT|nr:hypothetical protein [uncultured bacterium contig00021]
MAKSKAKAAAAEPKSKAEKGAESSAKGRAQAAAPKKGKEAWDTGEIGGIVSAVEQMLNEFMSAHVDDDSAMTGRERLRLFGAGVRNYGFIEKAWDIVRENPQFAPSQFDVAQFGADIESFDMFRQLYFLLEKFLQVVNEAMLTRSDALFREALRVYNNLREMSRGRVPGAEPLYRALLQFFRRRRTAEMVEGEEPTIKQLERDFNKLIHGHADGEIEVVSEKPRVSGGVRKVVDKVQTGRAVVKETAQAEIDK